MNRTAKSALAICSAFLLLCSVPAVAKSFSDKHTGNTIVASKRNNVAGGLLWSISANAVHSKRKGYGVAIEFLGTGTGWQKFSGAWSFGKKLDYVVGPSRVLGCAGGCTVVESGAIYLSRDEFFSAAKDGFEFELVGSSAKAVAKVPSKLFAEVIAELNLGSGLY